MKRYNTPHRHRVIKKEVLIMPQNYTPEFKKKIVHPKKPDYAHGKPHKVFENKLNQGFSADKTNQK